MYRLLAHTADLRAELTAPDAPSLAREAARLIRELLVGESPVAAREERRIALPAGDDAERFFRYVRELVYLADAERFLPADAEATANGMLVRGERFDPGWHVAERQIKALTRHHYVYERATGGGLRVELVFDL